MKKILCLIVLVLALSACDNDYTSTPISGNVGSIQVAGVAEPDFRAVETLLAANPLNVFAPETIELLGAENILKLFSEGSTYVAQDDSWEASGEQNAGGRLVIWVYPANSEPFQMDTLWRRDGEIWFLVTPTEVQ